MSEKETNLKKWQIKRVKRRASLIEEAIGLIKNTDFSSFNAYASVLADTLTKFEFMEAKLHWKKSGETMKFIPPKPASRQIFSTNKTYNELAEAGFALQRVSGAASIKKPRTAVEFKIVLDQKDYEISNLKAELSRSKAKNKHIKTSISSKNNLESSDNQISILMQDHSKTIQAVIKLLQWGNLILKHENGKIVDMGAIGKSRTVVEPKLLKHCSHLIDEGLDGFK